MNTKLTCLCFAFFLAVISSLFAQKPDLPKIHVTVQANMELMCVLHYLAGYLPQDTTAYSRDIDRYFAPYRRHKAVRQLQKIIAGRKQAAASDLIRFGRYFTPFPEFRFRKHFHSIDSLSLRAYYREKEVKNFLYACELFAKDTQFPVFFEAHQTLYQHWSDSVAALIHQEKYLVKDIQAFYQDKQKRKWEVLLCPLVRHFLGEALPPVEKGLQNWQFLMGFAGKNDPNPRELLRHLFIHEASHLYVSHLIYQKNAQEILHRRPSKYSDFEWLHKIDESLIHALCLYIEVTFYDKPTLFVPAEIAAAEREGFTYTYSFLALIKDYDQGEAPFEVFFEKILAKIP
jgi:hypothetical protein